MHTRKGFIPLLKRIFISPRRGKTNTHIVRGFTLIELLIVIGILAILATVTVLIINPADYLKRARDAQRLNDLTALTSAINLAETFVSLSGETFAFDNQNNATCKGGTGADTVYISVPSDGGESLPSAPSGWVFAWVPNTTLRNIDGSGWLPINLPVAYATQQSSPISKLPVDPVNTFASGNYYTYACGSYEITALFESQKFLAKALVDGGDEDGIFEVGKKLLAVTPTDVLHIPTGGTPPPPPPPVSPTVTSITPVNQGEVGVSLTITGSDFVSGASVDFSGTGITKHSTTFVNTTRIDVNVTIASGALSGARNVTVTNPDLQSDVCTGCLTINQVVQQTGYMQGSNIISTVGSWTAPTNGWFIDDADPPSFSNLAFANLGGWGINVLSIGGFSFIIPTGSTINGLCVHLNNISTSNQNTAKFFTALSWDGGITHTNDNTQIPSVTNTTQTGDEKYFKDAPTVPTNTPPVFSACTDWGHTSWTLSDISNVALRIKARNLTANPTDLRFDVAEINVVYTAP